MKELFEKLLKLDRVTYEKINDRIGIKTVWWENVCSEEGSPQDIFMGNMILDAVQCEIQRAIAARGWYLKQSQDCSGKLFVAVIGEVQDRYWSNEWKGKGDSPAKVILACYIEALHDI